MQKRMLTSLLASLMTAVLFFTHLPAQKAEAVLFTPNCTVQSESAILMNLDVNQIIYEKNADTKQMPAQLVQIMTAVIVLESCDDITKTELTAGEEMYETFKQAEYPEDLRYANIKAGDVLTVEDLLYAMKQARIHAKVTYLFSATEFDVRLKELAKREPTLELVDMKEL